MKRAILYFSLVVLTLSTTAIAQSRAGFGLKAGFFVADGNKHKGAVDDRATVGVTYRYPLTENLKLEASLEYMTEGSVVSTDWTDASSELDIIPLTATLLYQECASARFCPYVGAGIGIYHGWMLIEIDHRGVHINQEDTAPGYHAAVGIDIPLQRGSSFTGEVRYADAELELDAGEVSVVWGGEGDFPKTIDLEGYVVTFGYRFRF